MHDVNQASAVVNKRKAGWDGIRLEHWQLRSGEFPAHSHHEHVVLIALTNGCKGELITSSGIGIRGTQTRGNVCVLPSGLEHQAALEGDSEHLALYVEPSLITKAAADAQLSSRFEIAERYTRVDKVISSIGLALLGELDSEGLSGRLYAESLGNVLAVHLLRYYAISTSRPATFTGGLSASKLRHVTDFISENYSRDLKLAELAQVAGMSSFHFAREFKRSTGTTPVPDQVSHRAREVVVSKGRFAPYRGRIAVRLQSSEPLHTAVSQNYGDDSKLLPLERSNVISAVHSIARTVKS